MEKDTNKNFADFISGTSSWYEQTKWRKENDYWLKNSQKIAIKILSELRKKGLTQKDLANELNVSQQQVSKIVKGLENFTLETIGKIERALKISIISIDDSGYNLRDVDLLTSQSDTNIKNDDVITNAAQSASPLVNAVNVGEFIAPDILCAGEENSYAMAA